MHTNEIVGNSVLILGYGREGISVHAWLKKHYPSLHVAIADKKTDGDAYLEHLGDYDSVIRSPGVSPYSEKMQEYVLNGGHVTSATNIFFSLVKGMTVGVTGTKGKSTTSSLIAHILSSHYPDVRLAGNIGVPMLDSLDGTTDTTIFVLELSSHQLYDCRFSPHFAVLLGIVPEHLDYYPDLARYAKAKANIINHQSDKDFFIYNPNHTIVREAGHSSHAIRVLYSAEEEKSLHTFLHRGTIMVKEGKKEVPVVAISDVPLYGNEENVLAAVTVSHLMGVSVKTIAHAIKSFKSLPHRLEFVGEYKQIRFYNDSLATIPQATIHAIEALGEDVETLIVGGYDRGVDYSELGAYLRSHPVPTLVLLPDTGEKIWTAIGAITPEEDAFAIMRQYHASSMEEALRLSYTHTRPGKICLLSPASASYNMFRDYADRGEQFKDWAQKLGR